MSTTSPQGNPPEFKHPALRKRKLDQNQMDAFRRELGRIVSHFKRSEPLEAVARKLPNDQIRRVMQSLLTHLNHVCAASGPESKLQGYFWGMYSGWKASDDDRKVIAGFPKMVELMRRIVDDSITSKTYKIVPPATDRPLTIAMLAAQLLGQLEITVTSYDKGVWFKLTEYILLHGCGRDEKTETIRNYLKSVIGYFPAKKGGKIT